ncbi:hypothetical protein [uncultured Paracoccus sp.]|uniref:hypothetical protein n=1 Tax=uncultured Paracoccus sp. TaxID=189685 RepID=UPI002624A836|nr:hypothetical protein [uncultured Paracoccus sp.]
MNRMLMLLGCLAGVGLAMPAGSALAESRIEAPGASVEARLWQALRLDEMLVVMQDEALNQGDEMAEMLFEQGSDAGWRKRVSAIHDPRRLSGLLHAALTEALAEEPGELNRTALDFLEAPLGRQVVELELQARRAIIDQDTEDGAIAAFQQALDIEAPRLTTINRLIEGADLLEPTIAAALNEALAFSRGFGAEGGFTMPMTDAEMLEETWAQEPDIRAMIEEWLPAYLMLAYSPLSDEDLARYVEFATSDAGKGLWSAVNGAYEEVYTAISREMGAAAALHIAGRQL